MRSPHEAEEAGAIAGMTETYGRRRRFEDETVAFYKGSAIEVGHIVAVTEDGYLIRHHVPGEGSVVVEVRDVALLPY